jgi:hypothetical protein
MHQTKRASAIVTRRFRLKPVKLVSAFETRVVFSKFLPFEDKYLPVVSILSSHVNQSRKELHATWNKEQ